MDVELREIPGYDGYYADADGGVWSRKIAGSHGITRRLRDAPVRLKGWLGKNGYLYVTLRGLETKAHRPVHRLVLAAWTGRVEVGKDACHRDGDKTNNAFSNLYWGTRSENCADTKRHGRTPNAKLNNEVARAIRFLCAPQVGFKRKGRKVSVKRMAALHGVHVSQIYRALNNKR